MTHPPIANGNRLGNVAWISQMPSMRQTVAGWQQPLGLTRIEKRQVDYQTVDVEVPIPGQGVWQPFTPEQLSIRPEGERSWKWFEVHATTDLVLQTDDVVARRGTTYRVMADLGYDDNGFRVYHLVSDYQKTNG